jgi:integrase
MLRQQLASHKFEYVFPSRDGNRASAVWLEQLLCEACRLAGVTYGWKNAGGIVFHDTRHTAATRMLHAGMDLKTVASILGHSDVWITMRYGHATPASREAAVQSLGDLAFPGSPGVVQTGREGSDEAIPDSDGEATALG